MIRLDAVPRLRLERGAAHLHALGPRAIAELLAEVGHRVGGMPCILELLTEYQEHLTLAKLRAAGGLEFPARPLRVVPREAEAAVLDETQLSRVRADKGKTNRRSGDFSDDAEGGAA